MRITFPFSFLGSAGAVAPTLYGIDPAVGDTDGVRSLDATIYGADFAVGATVEIGGVAAMNIVVVDAEHITCVPAVVPSLPSPDFDGVDDKLALDVTRPNLLGDTGWTFAGFLDIRAPISSDPVLWTETSDYVSLSIVAGGLRLRQHNTDSSVVTNLDVNTFNVLGKHHFLARWNGTHLQLRIDGGAWIETAHAGIRGGGTFRLGCSASGTNRFFAGRKFDYAFAAEVLDNTACDNLIAYVNQRYGQDFGGIAPSSFDPATLNLSAWLTEDSYTSGTWTGTASAGASGGRNATEATNPPAVSTAAISRFHDVVVTNPSAPPATLTRGYLAWHPGSAAGCTLFVEKPNYATGTPATWTARVGTNMESTAFTDGTKPPAVDGEPDFDGSEGLKTPADLRDYLRNAEGTIAVLALPTTEDTLSADWPPYTRAQGTIWSKADSGPIGLFNAQPGSVGKYEITSFMYDHILGAFLESRKKMPSTAIGKTHAVVTSYVQAKSFHTSVDGSPLFDSAITIKNHPLTHVGAVRLGVDYATNRSWRGKVRAFALYNEAHGDDFSERFTAWSRARHGLILPSGVSSITTDVGDFYGGSTVTIKGHGFLGATGATVCGVALTSFEVLSNTTIRGVTGAMPLGVGDVVVQHPAGNMTLVNGFESFNPTSITGCIWWLRPDLGVTVNGSGEVILLEDQSGVGDSLRNVSPPGSDKPTLNVSDPDYNGKPTIGPFRKNDGGNDCNLRTAAAWSTSYTTFTLGVVGHAISTLNRYFTFGSDAVHTAIVNSANTPVVYGGAGTTVLQASGDVSALSVPGGHAAAEFNNGGTGKFFVNATERHSATGTLSADALGSVGMYLGAYLSDSTTYGVEKIAEVYAYSRTNLTVSERERLRKYLADRYGKVMA